MTQQTRIDTEMLCRESFAQFLGWVDPFVKSVKVKDLDYRIKFIPSIKLTSVNHVSRYGYVDYNERTIYVTDDKAFMFETLPHEIYHALSHEYKVYKHYSADEEERQANSFSKSVRGIFQDSDD